MAGWRWKSTGPAGGRSSSKPSEKARSWGGCGLTSPYHWHLDARALDLTRVISLDVPCLLDKCKQDPAFGYELMRRYAHHLAVQFRVTKVQLADFYGD